MIHSAGEKRTETEKTVSAVKKILITGFEPFGGEAVNPSWEAVRALPEEIGGWRLRKLRIPTVFGQAAERVLEAAEETGPDAILCVGQAGGRAGVTPEVIAINLREASIPDNAGNRPENVPIAEKGPAAYFSTVPVREMVRRIREAGIPASLSFSAGAFVCNDVLYTLLHLFHGTETRVGFIHVPFLPEQATESQPCMALEQMTQALILAVQAM